MVFKKSNEDDFEDIKFVDAEEYVSRPEASISYEDIILRQIQVCVNEGSKEMIGGYVKEKATSRGIVEEYIEDQRKKFIESLNRLYDLLLPFFDDIMNNASKEFDGKIENIRAEINKQLDYQLKSAMSIQTRARIQAQINTGYLEPDSIEAKKAIDDKLEVYRFLFQQMLLLYNRKRYLMHEEIV